MACDVGGSFLCTAFACLTAFKRVARQHHQVIFQIISHNRSRIRLWVLQLRQRLKRRNQRQQTKDHSAGNFIDSALVPAAFKFLFHVGLQDVQALCFSDKPRGDAQDIGIVVLLHQFGYLAIPSQSSSNRLVLIGCHRNAVGRTTDQDAEVGRCARNILRNGVCMIGVIHTFL